jgi:hypothetical protein
MDPLLGGFLEVQLEKGTALAARSDVLEIQPIGPPPVQAYVAVFEARGLVRQGDEVAEARRLEVGVRFPRNYLREANAAEVLTVLFPREAFHPNILSPLLCPGFLRPGTSLPDLLHQVHEIWTWQNVNMNERDALNRMACAWARANRDRFPIDRRPLCRPRPPEAPR